MPTETYADEVEEIRARMRGGFGTVYLTLLSIIQGTVLAGLFAKVDSLIGRHSFHAPQIIMAAGIFLWIVALWHQYQMGLMLYNWTAQLIDAFIPFLLGLFEFAAIIGMEHGVSYVLLALGVFFLIGIAAFENQYLQARRNVVAPFFRRLTGDLRAFDSLSCVASSAVAFGAALLTSRADPASGYQVAGAWVIVALAIAHMVRQTIEWRIILRRLTEMAAVLGKFGC